MALMQSVIINYTAKGVGTWYKAKAKPKGRPAIHISKADDSGARITYVYYGATPGEGVW